jgi:hypothetical protein
MKLSIPEESQKLLKQEIADLGIKDNKGRKISLKYFVKQIEVVEEETGSWSSRTFPKGPGTYYTVTTVKLRDGKPFGATFNTKYVDSQEEALRIGQDYLKKGMKKLSSPTTFKEYFSLSK